MRGNSKIRGPTGRQPEPACAGWTSGAIQGGQTLHVGGQSGRRQGEEADSESRAGCLLANELARGRGATRPVSQTRRDTRTIVTFFSTVTISHFSLHPSYPKP